MAQIILNDAQITKVIDSKDKKNNPVQYVTFNTIEGDELNITAKIVDLSKLPRMEKMNFALNVKFYVFQNRTGMELVGIKQIAGK